MFRLVISTPTLSVLVTTVTACQLGSALAAPAKDKSMSFWNPEKTREQMLRGTIAMEHAWEYDASKPMGNWARGMVSSTAEAHFVGLGNQMLDLCPRAIEWIDRAIERNEEFAGETQAYHQRLTAAKALAGWFSSGINDTAVWKAAF